MKPATAVAILPTPSLATEGKEEKIVPPTGSFRLVSLFGTQKTIAAKLPPNIATTPHVRHVFRFISTSASAVGVTVNDLLGMCGSVCTVVNSYVVTLSSSVRVNSVRCFPAAGGTVQLQWNAIVSGIVPDDEHDMSTPTGVTMTGPSTFTPPPKSLCDSWMNSTIGSTPLFHLASSVGSIVDVNVSFRISNVLPGVAVAVTAGTLGAFYYLALDGPSSNTYTPLGVPTTH